MRDNPAPPADADPPRDSSPQAPRPEALDDAEFRLLADNLPTLAWIADATGYIVWYNRRWHEYCGTTPAQMEGWGWQAVHDPSVLPEVMARWTASIATGEPFEMTFPLRGTDSVFRPFLTRIVPVRDREGGITRWVGTNVDVSGQVTAEAALRAERDRSRRVLEGMGEAYMLLDRDLRILDVNDEALRLDPRSREAIVGRLHGDAYPDLQAAALEPLYRRVLDDGRQVGLEHEYQWADGRTTWLDMRAFPVEDGVAVFYRDVTERVVRSRALEASAREQAASRAEQEAILGQLEEGVIVTDREGRITFVNEAAERLHGVKTLDVAPDDYTQTYHLLTLDGEPHPVEDLPLARAVQRGETVTDARWRIRRPDGTEVLAIGTAKPLVIAGEVAGHVLTLRDDTRRVEAETALRESEERFRLVADTAPALIWTCDGEANITFVNRWYYEMFGRPADEMLGDGWKAIVHPDDVDFFFSEFLSAFDRRDAFEREVRVLDRYGRVRWLHCRGAPRIAANGAFLGYTGVNVDVTGRVEAEAARRASDQRYRTLFEAIEVGFCVIELKFDEAGRPIDYLFVEANPAFARLLGLDDAPGRWMREIAPDHEQYWFDAYGRVATTGEPIQFEQWTGAFGRWLELQAFRIAGPEPNRVAVLFSDITERKASEAALRDSEERLRLATDAAEVGLWDVDLVADRLIWPPRVKAMFGISPDAPVSMDDFYAGLHPDDAEATADAFAAAVDPARRAIYDVEYRTVGKEDGILRWVSAKGRGIFDKEGQCIRVVGAALDITERKRTAEALREKDATIKAFYETSNLYTAVLELEPDDFCFVTANRETARFYGVEDLTSRKGTEFMPGDVLPRMLGALHSAHDKKEAVTLEYPFRVGRQTRWYLSTLAPMPAGASGNPRVSVASFDITDRKRAERALKASEERLEAITDSVDQMIWSTRPDGYHDYYNRRWYEFTGMPPGTTDGEEWNGMFHPDDQGRAWERWRESLDTGDPYEIEYRLRHRSGQYRWVIGRARAVRDAEGRISRWYGTCTDVHALKTAEAALLDESRTLETLNRTGNALAGELDLERLVQMVTDAGVELTGADYGAFFYSSQEDTNDFALYTLSGAKREDFEFMGRPRVTAIFGGTFVDKRVIRSDDILADPEYGQMAPHHGTPEGHLPVRSYLGVPVIGRSGEVIGAMLFAHGEPGQFNERHERLITGVAAQAAVAIDNARLLQGMQGEVAERTRAEEALRELNATLEARIAEAIAEREQAEAQLRQAQKMEAVGQLTGGIAHDFNNLLTVVMGNIDMGRRALAGGADGAPRIKRALDNAQRGAERAAALTQRLLAFARRQPLLPKPLDVDRLVAGMSDLLTRSLGETVQLEVVTAPGLWRVETDPNQLESAILNLAVNARDAMPGGGRLSIETANANLEDSYSAAHAEVAPGQYVVIAVSDTGEGMSRETLDHVFEPFFTTKEVGKGTGLGLSQVYGFVKQSGGHVKVYSEPGAGTTVKIYLPRMLAGGEIEDDEGEADPERAHARETILVVEDDADVRRYSSEAVRELGYKVLEAEDGAGALRILEREAVAVDLLFTDVVMPGLSGRELAEAARALRPGLRVLFTSGYTRNAIARNGHLEPGTAMIAKPFSFPALARKIRDVLDTGQSGRLLVMSGVRFGGAEALEEAGYIVDAARDAGEVLQMVRAGPGMFDAVIVEGDAQPRVAARLYRELRALRVDLPVLLIADAVGAALRQALGQDSCGALLPPASAGEQVARALSELGVRCAEAHAQARAAIQA